MMENAGFDVTRITYCNSTLFFPVLAMRKGKNWLRRLRGHEISDHPESDLAFYPKPINELLYRIVTTETRLMEHMNLPVGVSILAIAQRPLVSSEAAASANISIDSLVADAESAKVLAAR
jgi:hypothetical protein